jgi:hypothetical protein
VGVVGSESYPGGAARSSSCRAEPAYVVILLDTRLEGGVYQASACCPCGVLRFAGGACMVASPAVGLIPEAVGWCCDVGPGAVVLLGGWRFLATRCERACDVAAGGMPR